MKNTQLESRIYFTEKDIYDALMSSKRKMSMSLLTELARDRGILISSDDTREDIIKYLSSLVYDYYDLKVLIDHITPAHKKEKAKVTQVNGKIDGTTLKSVTKEINDNNVTIQTTIDSKDQNTTILQIEYDEIDFSKTRLRQKVRKESTIEVTVKDGLTTISKPSNDKTDEIMKKILDGIEKKTATPLIEKKINLFELKHEDKIGYFTKLINAIEDCKLKDVVKVSVNHEDKPEAEDDAVQVITNASFKGKGLLSTQEYQNLKKEGYYITSIIWTSDEIKKNGDIIEFEASISSSKDCEELSFAAKGAYRFIDKDRYTTGRRPLKTEEIKKYTSYLEEASFKIFDEITEKEL